MADTKVQPLQHCTPTEEKEDEASELASLAGASADTDQPIKPSPLSGGAQERPPASLPAKESSGQSPVPLKDMNHAPNGESK